MHLQMLEEKLKKGLKMIGEYMGGADDDSGLDIGGAGTETPLEMEEPIDAESLSINLKVSSIMPEISTCPQTLVTFSQLAKN